MFPGRRHGVIVIIPRPVKAHAHPDGGRVTLTADGFVIAADEASRPVAGLLRAALEASTGWDIAVVPVSSEAGPNAVTLTAGLPDGGLPDSGWLPAGGYRLRAIPGEGVVITAGARRAPSTRRRPCGCFPSPYVHLGGDECPATEWHDSDRARQRMRSLGLRAEAQLQGWFMAQVAMRLADRGRRMVGWDEVIDAGGPQDAVIMAWRKDGYMGRWAAELGHPVVMAPEYYVYLDWAHSDDKSEPLAIRGATSVADVYTFDPVPRGLSEGARENIIGAQAQLWTEYIPDTGKAEYMYFPRLCAFAEVVWSPPGGELAEFEERLTRHLPRLDARHVNYRQLS